MQDNTSYQNLLTALEKAKTFFNRYPLGSKEKDFAADCDFYNKELDKIFDPLTAFRSRFEIHPLKGSNVFFGAFPERGNLTKLFNQGIFTFINLIEKVEGQPGPFRYDPRREILTVSSEEKIDQNSQNAKGLKISYKVLDRKDLTVYYLPVKDGGENRFFGGGI